MCCSTWTAVGLFRGERIRILRPAYYERSPARQVPLLDINRPIQQYRRLAFSAMESGGMQFVPRASRLLPNFHNTQVICTRQPQAIGLLTPARTNAQYSFQFLDTCIYSPSCVHLRGSTLLLLAWWFLYQAIHGNLKFISRHLHQFTLVRACQDPHCCVFWTPASIHPRACICQDPHCCCLPVFARHLHQFTLLRAFAKIHTAVGCLCFLDTCIYSPSCVHLPRSTMLLLARW